MFHLDSQKEAFPYELYKYANFKQISFEDAEGGQITYRDLKRTYLPVSRADEYFKDEATKETFKKNVERLSKEGKLRCQGGYFNLYDYCAFYCEQDVRILAQGLFTFADSLKSGFNVSLHDFLTAAGMSQYLYEKNAYSSIQDLYEYSGKLRRYICGAIYGGRCMTRDNKKYEVKEAIEDFDAVSLYPSAMSSMGIATGKPQRIENELGQEFNEETFKNSTLFKTASAFVCDIDITKIGKPLHFPIIVKRTKEGLNNVNELGRMRVDNILLRSLLKYQKITFRLLRGYFWTGPLDYHIAEFVKKLFKERQQLKAEKNPLEQVYKIMLNSAYGKTIEKEHNTKQVLKYEKTEEQAQKLNDYLFNHYSAVRKVEHVTNTQGDNVKAFIEEWKERAGGFNLCLFGVQILSRSKEIMAEKFDICEDVETRRKEQPQKYPFTSALPYYQDTDSFFIQKEALPFIVEEYNRRKENGQTLFNQPLIGKELGQFHGDFPIANAYSSHSYFLMKKAYFTHLKGPNGEEEDNFRLKGVSQGAVIARSLKKLPRKVPGFTRIECLYAHMFDGGKITFDLRDGGPRIEITTDFTLKTKFKFEREVKTIYETGTDF
jgi:hypothetical protein